MKHLCFALKVFHSHTPQCDSLPIHTLICWLCRERFTCTQFGWLGWWREQRESNKHSMTEAHLHVLLSLTWYDRAVLLQGKFVWINSVEELNGKLFSDWVKWAAEEQGHVMFWSFSIMCFEQLMLMSDLRVQYGVTKVVSSPCHNVIYFHNIISLQGTHRERQSNSTLWSILKNAFFSLRDHSWWIMKIDHKVKSLLTFSFVYQGLKMDFYWVKPV